MRKTAIVLFLALAAPLATLPAMTGRAEAKIHLDISIGGVTLHEMRRWRADDPLARDRLVWRLDKLRGFLQFPFLKNKDRRHATALIRAYEARLAAPVISASEADARGLLAGHPDLPRLSGRELRRIEAGITGLLASPDITLPTRRRLVRLRRRVRAELQARAMPRLPADESAARDFLARARGMDLRALPRRRLRHLRARTIDHLASLDISRPTRAALAALRREINGELMRRRAGPPQAGPGERRARRLLARAGNLRGLSSAQLEDLWMETLQLLSRPGLRPRTRDRLASLRQRLAKALGARRASTGARRLLADRRPPSRLSQDQLRARLERLRKALRNPDLPDGLFARLRRMLARDRAELRRRIAMRDDGMGTPDALAGTNALLADDRPSSSLSTPALRRRILALRKALTLRGLSRWRRGVLRRKLDADRAQLRARLIRARDRRRAALRGARVPIGMGHASRSTIIAGESGARAIERQLAAAPRMRLARRFTLRELRARPDLRDYMPAIDLNSIHFGFNEFWLREEEIGKLERIGEAIERILATNPDEVFLIEGHTDAPGSFDYNQRLSEKRARAVKEALTQYFNISSASLVTIGYGERFPKIPTLRAEPENRRVSIRRITPLLRR